MLSVTRSCVLSSIVQEGKDRISCHLQCNARIMRATLRYIVCSRHASGGDGPMKISIRQGDITDVEADAIVNAANSSLCMGAGVAGAIKRKGGESIEEEAIGKGPIPVGEAVATGAGNLPAKYVIHAAVMGPDLQTDAQKIKQATLNSFKRADELGVHSIAFPALGTGVGGFPLQQAAKVMFRAIAEHLSQKTPLQEVMIILYSGDAYEAFAAEAAAYQGEHYIDLTD